MEEESNLKVMPNPVHVIAEQLFNAYNEQGPNPWKTFDGRDVPKWSELTPQVYAKWCAVAGKAISLIFTEEDLG